MSVPLSHVFQQGPVIGSFLRTALATARKRPTAPLTTPGTLYEAVLKPRPRGLIDDYLRHIGAEPSWYKGTLPAHLWPQWGFPLAAATLSAAPYELAKVMNGSSTLIQHAPLPDNEPLIVRAWLDSVDDDGTRALLVQKVVTGTASAPDALEATITAFVPLAKREGGAKRERPTVADTAREIGRQRVGRHAGRDFALLTGDFNPVHWVAPWARAFGFKSTILHGFSTMARACATLDKAVFSGDPSRLASLDVRFVSPVVLPNELAFYVEGDQITVGQHHGAPAFMTGTFTRNEA